LCIWYKEEPVLDPLTARFIDPELEAEFWNDRFETQLHAQLPSFYGIAALMAALMGIADWLTLPSELQPMLQALRFGVLVPAGLSAALYSSREPYRRIHQRAAVALACAGGCYLLMLHVIAGPIGPLFPMALAPLVVVLPLMFRLDVPWAAIFWLSIMGAYIAVNALWVQADPAAIGVVLSTILVFGIAGLFVLRSTEGAARRQYTAGQIIESERARSERLLLNILPPPIAARLKNGEGPIADEYTQATVLFADIAGFTDWSGTVSPTIVVERLQEIFNAFDALALKHGCEKIKTIGDAYMVAAGLPLPRDDHAEAIAEMALEMFQVLDELNRSHEHRLNLRLGINTGPVVAGVIGAHKFVYDLWGDAVNLASRMESQGVVGRIQVTEAVYETLKNQFHFEARGQVEVKGKGKVATWFLVNRA
jgi:class 3 adenylate cyclase